MKILLWETVFVITADIFGIFLEDQHIFGDAAHRTPTYPKGVIIANNICRNGRNYGFGVRGGQHVIFDGNEAYENANGGFFSDYQNKSIVIQNNLIRDNTGNGICLGNEKTRGFLRHHLKMLQSKTMWL